MDHLLHFITHRHISTTNVEKFTHIKRTPLNHCKVLYACNLSSEYSLSLKIKHAKIS